MNIESNSIFKLKRKELKKAINIAVDAFMDYPVPGSFIIDKTRRKIVLYEMFKIIFKMAYRNSHIYTLGGDFKEVSLWSDTIEIPKDSAYIRYISLSTIRLMFNANGRELKNLMRAFSEIENVKKKLVLPPNTAELMVLAVSPSCQKQGRAKAMINPILDKLSLDGISCLVITNTEVNRDIYQKMGFQLIEQYYDNRCDINTFFLLKNPENK